MSQESILYRSVDGVARITLNRPDKLNSFDETMAVALQRSIERAAGDREVRAVYLTGAGRGFCAGQDLAAATPTDDDPEPDLSAFVRGSYNPIVRGLRSLAKPVVCGVNGVAAGAGANLALACDIVVAVESASFIQSFCKIGLVPDTGGSYFLPRLVGAARASAMMMLGEKLGAQEAARIGLIYRVCPDDGLEREGYGLAAELARQPTAGLALIKAQLQASAINDLDAQLELEAEYQGRAGRTDDFKEGVRAFMEKREPSYKGR